MKKIIFIICLLSVVMAAGCFTACSAPAESTSEETNSESEIVETVEGIDINPAAAVATASLIQAINNNQVEKDAVIMLNITGGGEKRFKENKEIFYLQPTRVFDVDADKEEIKEFVKNLF